MAKENCWEFKKCGREEGGVKASELGACRSAIETNLDGVHGGKNGGRACWALKGTLCNGVEQQNLALKLTRDCLQCDFLKQVMMDEARFLSVDEIIQKTRQPALIRCNISK